jgi:acyl-CoA thioester hydrolase
MTTLPGPALRSRIAVAGEEDRRDLPGDFAHRRTIEVRFADTDAMGHVNNAVYMTYCETARIAYWAGVTGEPVRLGTDGAESLILAEARITYRAPAFHGETVTIETRANRIGRSSFNLEHRLTARVGDGPARLVAISESILVRYDYANDRPVAISPEHRRAIEAFEGRALGGEPGTATARGPEA